MKYLLDTHIVLWYLNGDDNLSETARSIIDDEHNEIYFSLASMWEIEIKHIIHPTIMQNSGYDVFQKCKQADIFVMPIEAEHIRLLHTLQREENVPKHNDPFDRILICQAKAENMLFITHDSLIPYYNEPCILSV